MEIKIKLVFLLSFSLIVNSFSYSQESKVYLPLNFQNALETGTRTLNGKPGANYWQNSSDYEITVELLPDSSYLVGSEKVTYYNNSPDSLKEIVIRLYQNIFKVGSIRDWYVSQKYLNNGVKLNYMILDGDSLDISDNSREIVTSSTNLIIKLKEKIPPNSKIDLDIGWEFEIPYELRLRMGNYGDGNFYVAYWYPQISVYDDIDGWDKINYGGWVEFYNDFNNYDVKIKVPKGILVWATGELNNSKDVLRQDIFEKYELAQISDSTINIVEKSDYETGIVTSENEFNIWHFKAENVTDFTFATSKTFNWDGTSVIVDSSTGRRALTDVIYKDRTVHYDNSAQYARATIEYLSSNIPGYPYPYSHATSYCNGNRGGGMESPMMANNGAPKQRPSHVGLIFHEISHNYFPFMMGTNERKYAWMDEGWASFLPTDLVQYYDSDYDYRERTISSYENRAGYESDLPLVIPSYSYKTSSARIGFYNRPAAAYYELMELLGRDLFIDALWKYIDRWEGKHPLPYDFFFTFDYVAKEDLSWFWKPWFIEYGYPDLGLSDFSQNDGNVSVTVNKIGNLPTRIELTLEFENGENKKINKSEDVWNNGENSFLIKYETSEKIKKVILGNKYIPDINEDNK